MDDIAIKVESISKQYQIGVSQYRHDTLRDHLMDGVKSVFRWERQRSTLDARALSVYRHNLGLEGRLLRGQARRGGRAHRSQRRRQEHPAQDPVPDHRADAGRAEIRGRVGSLLEVGTGFHRELTGRENIYLNGAILGMRKAEIDRKFDEIVAFSEVEKFLDTPGQALLQRDVCAPGLRGGRASGAGDPAGGRSAGGGRRGIPEEVPREDGRCHEGGPDRSCSSATTWPPFHASVRGPFGSIRARRNTSLRRRKSWRRTWLLQPRRRRT